MGDPTGDARAALPGSRSSASAPNPAAPNSAALDRYTALVAALLGVRTDYASARFDSEVAAALAANRLDVATARTLRWWQRESVREVEGYASSVLPAVLANRSDADTVASIDLDESAASWQQAQIVRPSPTSTVVLPVVAEPAPISLPARVITIPDPSTRRRSAREIQQAVREALRAAAAPLDPGPPFDVRSPQDASSHGRDRGDHAHTAPTA